MADERECCDDYVERQPEDYEREVPVGNLLLRDRESLQEAAAGPFAGSIDALQTPFESGRERLVECKQSPTVRGLGQLLIYAYFRRRDRDVARTQFEAQNGAWQTARDIRGRETHVYSEGDGSDRTYHVKPAITKLDQVLVACDVASSDALLLSAYVDHGVTIEHRTNGTWRRIDAAVFETETGNQEPSIDWLTKHSRESLDSAAEDDIWDDASEFFEDTRCFKEVPIGTHLYPNRQTALRADAVVRAGDHWFVVEVKQSESDEARADFQTAFGQTASYASLFAREWGLPSNRVAPVVVQHPLAIVGGVYRDDRYGDDYQQMRTAAFADSSQPFVLGPPQTFG